MERPRILLADDHPQMLSNLCRLAETVGEVIGAASDGQAAVNESLRLHPDVVVLDLVMPGVGGLEAARRLRRDLPECKVVICSMYTQPEVIADAFAAGAVGFVRKQSAHVDLAPAIRAAVAGETFISPSLVDGVTSRQKDGDGGQP
ncbi:MAG: response regulator transcription factor [Nitrospira sp.]|nr:response regulator transcription factor [Nitrospira sp.]MDH5337468.1 response regulator transcription factor [Nitrospira sp.]